MTTLNSFARTTVGPGSPPEYERHTYQWWMQENWHTLVARYNEYRRGVTYYPRQPQPFLAWCSDLYRAGGLQ